MKENFYINLIYKKLTGEISNIELQELESWLAQSAKNKAIYQKVKQEWQGSANLKPLLEVTLNKEQQALQKEVQAAEESDSPSRRGTVVALIILVLLALGIFLFKDRLFKKTEWKKVETANVHKKIILADGTAVHLNKNSAIHYPVSFEKDKRLVEIRGEAFFDVIHKDHQPFFVETTHAEIQVLGTAFNVKEDSSKMSIQVDVTSGTVEFKSKDNDYETVTLHRDQQAVYHWNTQTLEDSKPSSSNNIAWLTKELHFVNIPLSQAIPQIEALYDIQIEVENDSLTQCPFTGIFEELTVYQALESISAILEVEVDMIDAKRYTLKGGSCRK